MRRTFIYDRDLESIIEITDGRNAPPQTKATRGIIRDIEPYRPVASDIGAGGKRPVIGGRRQHREFLRRNGYVEVGNEKPISGERPTLSKMDRINDIKRALGEG
jgi:hypothetical protein